MDSEKDRIYQSCTRFLGLHYPQSPRHALAQLASAVDEETTADRYGEGDVIASFEKEVAEALGKESAVFMPSGTMCQQIALRIWAEQRGTSHIAFHPTSHQEQLARAVELNLGVSSPAEIELVTDDADSAAYARQIRAVLDGKQS